MFGSTKMNLLIFIREMLIYQGINDRNYAFEIVSIYFFKD